MTVLTEGPHTGQFILSEANGILSRDNVTVTVPAHTTLEAGTVLGALSGSGHFVPYDDASSDGRETAAAILYAAVLNDTAIPADLEGVVIDCLAEVRAADLVFGDGVDEDAAIASLAQSFIKARD
jgi:Bacteriophage lambda head decoration protein D